MLKKQTLTLLTLLLLFSSAVHTSSSAFNIPPKRDLEETASEFFHRVNIAIDVQSEKSGVPNKEIGIELFFTPSQPARAADGTRRVQEQPKLFHFDWKDNILWEINRSAIKLAPLPVRVSITEKKPSEKERALLKSNPEAARALGAIPWIALMGIQVEPSPAPPPTEPSPEQ